MVLIWLKSGFMSQKICDYYKKVKLVGILIFIKIKYLLIIISKTTSLTFIERG